MIHIEQCIVHHSGASRSQSFDAIRAFHMAPKPRGRGFSDIAYHYVILGDGSLRIGRPLPVTGAHAPPNSRRIGILVTGDNTREGMWWSAPQKRALMELWLAIRKLWPEIELAGHRDVMPGHTECPGLDVRELLFYDPPSAR